MTIQPDTPRLDHAVTVYGTPSCVQCKAVVRTFDQRGVAHTYVDAAADPDALAYLKAEGVQQVPYVVIAMDSGEHVTFTGNRRDLIDVYFPREVAA